MTMESTISATATIVADAIKERQDEFARANEGLPFLSVADYNQILQTSCEEACKDILAAAQPDPEGGSYESSVSYTQYGLSVKITVTATGFVDTAREGAILQEWLQQSVGQAVYGLLKDATGEHRRRHVEELLDYERSLDRSDFDEVKLRGQLEHAPLGTLCGLALEIGMMTGQLIGPDDFAEMATNAKPESRKGVFGAILDLIRA